MSRSGSGRVLRPILIGILGLAGVVAAVLVYRAMARRPVAAVEIPTEAVTERDLTVTVEATGVVEPIDVVEVKSKASGQIVRMPVEIGSLVKAGDLLVQIDTRDVRNGYDQAAADLTAAQASLDVSKSRKERSDELFRQQVITAEEHETAQLEFATRQAQLVGARTSLDLARQRLEDATVRAPIDGTVIDKPVSAGQVISSATSSASGGTTLLQMADLGRIRVRALVNETDIGNVKTDQSATVEVDAYPQRSFAGRVEKLEPRAVVSQSVTMFPVLISLDNSEGLLLPGMNGEVTVLVQSADNVLAVPVDAVRSVREMGTAAAAVGLDGKTVQEQLRGQVRSLLRGDSASAEGGSGRRRASGSDTSRAGAFRRRPAGAAGAARPNASGGPTGNGSGNGRAVFVKTADGLVPRLIRIGISNYDYYQVLAGLQAGEEVVLLSAAELQRQRQEGLDRMRQRISSTMPGVQSQGTTSSTGRASSPGGGPRGDH